MNCTWLPRSRGFTPFLVASTGSPSKYAARCSNSVKSSMLIKARCEPKIFWMFTPSASSRMSFRNASSTPFASGMSSITPPTSVLWTTPGADIFATTG